MKRHLQKGQDKEVASKEAGNNQKRRANSGTKLGKG